MIKKDTSWGEVAEWYSDHVEGEDTYHSKVILPNLLRLVNPKGKRILEIGCGEGYFARHMQAAGADVDAADISTELIGEAKKKGGGVRCMVAPADRLSFADENAYDVVLAVLTLQNMERLEPVFEEVMRVLKPTGEFIAVLNHPVFRIPKETSWGWDEQEKIQYRRIDKYLSSKKSEIDMTPGREKGKVTTLSFHRSLQDYVKAFAGAGFAVVRLEEWISHRKSGPGPRQQAEDIARKEFPLFLALTVKAL